MIPPPRNILVSYHYFKAYDLDKLAGLHIIGDSGAFSAHTKGHKITTAELAAWARQWRHRLAWLASLDVIGDQAATRRNWHEMTDREGLPGVPTIHFGSEPEAMDYYAERGVDFIGLGGLVGHPAARQMRWLVSMFRYARDTHPQMRFHGWGVTGEAHLNLPFYSIDSSAWTAPCRFGTVRLRDPNHPTKTYTVQLDGRGGTYSTEVARLLRDHYGLNPSQIARSGGANRAEVLQVSALTTSVQEARFRRIHRPGITRPEWGRLGGTITTGPNLHLVTGYDNAHPQRLSDLAERVGPYLHIADTTEKGMEMLVAMNRRERAPQPEHLS